MPDSVPDTVTVTGVSESPRKPGRYRVGLSDGRTLIVTAGIIAEAGVMRIGAMLGPDALSWLTREAAVTGVVDRAVNALARGRRTRRELERRLARHEPDRAVISVALDRLESSGLLSDSEAAAAEARSRLRRGEAPMRVRQRLAHKGIAERDAAAAVASAVEDESFDETQACRAAADKRMRALHSADAVVARRRLTGFLLRRGFAGHTVREVVNEHFPR